jgi:hypothetical protein
MQGRYIGLQGGLGGVGGGLGGDIWQDVPQYKWKTQTCTRDLLSLLLLHYRVGCLACLLQTAKPPSAATDRISTGEQRVDTFVFVRKKHVNIVALPLGARAPLKKCHSRGNFGSESPPNLFPTRISLSRS